MRGALTDDASASTGIGRKSTLIFANTAVGALMGAVALKAVSIYLGADPLGEVTYAAALLGLIAFATDFGFNTAHMKRISEGVNAEDATRTFFVFKVCATTFYIFLGLSFILGRVVVLGRPFESVGLDVLFLMLSYYAARSMTNYGLSTFGAYRETARGEVAIFLENVVKSSVTITAALLIGALTRNAGVLAGRLPEGNAFLDWLAANPGSALALAWFLGGIASLLTAAYYMRNRFQGGHFRWDILKSYWSFALPLFLILTVSVLSANIDRAALGYFWGPTEVGLYEAPRRVTQLIEAVPIAVATLLLPTVSALTGDREKVNEITHRATRYVSLVVFPLVGGTIVLAAPVVTIILSAEWLPAVPVLQVLAIYTLLLSLTRPYEMLLAGTNHPGATARIAIAMAVTNVVLNILLIPADIKSLGIRLGGLREYGAALATMISGIVGLILATWTTWKVLGIRPTTKPLLHLVATLVMMGALTAVDVTIMAGVAYRVWHLVFFAGLGAGIYIIVLALLREFTGEDMRYFVDLLHVGDMVRYIRGELKK